MGNVIISLQMPPKKGKKGKGAKDDGWGDDKEVEEKLKKLLVADDEAGEFKGVFGPEG